MDYTHACLVCGRVDVDLQDFFIEEEVFKNAEFFVPTLNNLIVREAVLFEFLDAIREREEFMEGRVHFGYFEVVDEPHTAWLLVYLGYCSCWERVLINQLRVRRQYAESYVDEEWFYTEEFEVLVVFFCEEFRFESESVESLMSQKRL